MDNFFNVFIRSAKEHWDSFAVTEYGGRDLTYGSLVQDIIELQAFWINIGLKPGDKVAICARNCIGWVSTYMAAVSAGYIAVLIPNNVPKVDIISFINHSESRLLYIDESVDCGDFSSLPNLLSIIDINNYHIIATRTDIDFSIPNIQNSGIDINSQAIDDNQVCTIAYTSGSSSVPKGVMLSYLNLSFALSINQNSYSYQNDECLIAFLPFYHIMGLLDNLIIPICSGVHVVITSTNLEQICMAFQKYHPNRIFLIPLFINVIVNSALFSIVNGNDKQKLQTLQQHPDHISQLKTKILNTFGGKVKMIFTGGAAMEKNVAIVVVDILHLPLFSGYGLTECPGIAVGKMKCNSLSCGKLIDGISLRIDSESQQSIPGEIQVKGDNVFVGYYKDDGATAASFTDDGWFKTGDMGYIDEDDNLFITGRCKDMMLTSNGENIYPEEVESSMNASPFVKESILVQRGEELYAIVVPDMENAEAENLDAKGLNKKIDEAVWEASKKLPGFTIISGFELRDEPLERTPKGSLMRYLYSDGIKEN